MWADWVGGGGLELEVILGNAVRAGEKAGVAMPRCQGMYAVLKVAQGRREKGKPGSKL